MPTNRRQKLIKFVLTIASIVAGLLLAKTFAPNLVYFLAPIVFVAITFCLAGSWAVSRLLGKSDAHHLNGRGD